MADVEIWIEESRVLLSTRTTDPLSLTPEEAESVAARILVHAGIVRAKKAAQDGFVGLLRTARDIQSRMPGGSGKPKRWKK